MLNRKELKQGSNRIQVLQQNVFKEMLLLKE